MTKITAYFGVLEEQLEKRKKRVNKELKKAKKDRDREFLKKELKDIKKTKQILKDGVKESKKLCPSCGHECEKD